MEEKRYIIILDKSDIIAQGMLLKDALLFIEAYCNHYYSDEVCLTLKLDSSVTIKGMKVPRSCEECQIRYEKDDEIYCPLKQVVVGNKSAGSWGKPLNCPVAKAGSL